MIKDLFPPRSGSKFLVLSLSLAGEGEGVELGGIIIIIINYFYSVCILRPFEEDW